MEVWSPSQQTAIFIWDLARVAGQGNLPSLSPPWELTLGPKQKHLQQQLWPPVIPTLVDDALCDKFALPPLVITQWPPVENQASPEVLGQAQQGHQGTRVEQSEFRTGQDLNLQRQLHPQKGGDTLGNRP